MIKWFTKLFQPLQPRSTVACASSKVGPHQGKKAFWIVTRFRSAVTPSLCTFVLDRTQCSPTGMTFDPFNSARTFFRSAETRSFCPFLPGRTSTEYITAILRWNPVITIIIQKLHEILLGGELDQSLGRRL